MSDGKKIKQMFGHGEDMIVARAVRSPESYIKGAKRGPKPQKLTEEEMRARIEHRRAYQNEKQKARYNHLVAEVKRLSGIEEEYTKMKQKCDLLMSLVDVKTFADKL